jgi:membrane protein DedA with SNARE-associated domain/pimeloyl-ACP methyl ester carboxylesterase
MKLNKILEYYSNAWSWFVTAWLLALLLSWSVIYMIEKPVMVHKNQTVVQFEDKGRSYNVSYFHFIPDHQARETPVVMMHDNMNTAEALIPLAARLMERGFEVIIPEYTGYGFTDYPAGFSLEDKKKSVSKILEINNIDKYQAIGYGLGGAVTYYLTDQPDRSPESIILISALVMQELHLTGSFSLNRFIYLLQFPAYHLMYNLTPHFGWFDQLPISYTSLKSNYESDLRPLGHLMDQYQNPVLIVNGMDDHQVDSLAAREYHRLIPHSELEFLAGNHLIISDKAHDIAHHAELFFNRVNNGTATWRADALLTRIENSRAPLDPDTVTSFAGITLILFLLLLVASTFVNEDLTCIAAGLIAAKGIIDYIPAVIACFIGILLTDITVYWLGRWLGSPILQWIPFRWFIDEEDVRKTENVFKENGLPIIFLTRFIPGTRLPTYFSAGMVKARFSLIIIYFLLAILIWAPFLVGVSYFIGQQILDYFHFYQEYAYWIFALLLLMIFMGVKLLIPMTTKRGRRRLKVKVEKMRRRLSG